MRWFFLFIGAVLAQENNVIVEPAFEENPSFLNAVYENDLARRLNGGLGLQLGPIGAGFGGNLGFNGINFGAGAGLGNNGQYLNYNPYYSRPVYYVPNRAREIGLGGGVQFGPLGFGLNGGVGSSGINFGANAGLGNYQTSNKYYQTSPFGLGGGLQLGPVGFGLGGGISSTGLQFGAGAGLGSYGNNYYQTYQSTPYKRVVKPIIQSFPSARNLGGGAGFNFGPLGLGVAAGFGNQGLNFNAGAGFNNQYQYYGTPAYYSTLYQ